jgi:hypothetical protein
VTRYHPSEFEKVGLRYRCAHCDAEPGEWCYTKSNIPSQFLHAPRHYRAMEYRERRNRRTR